MANLRYPEKTATEYISTSKRETMPQRTKVYLDLEAWEITKMLKTTHRLVK